MTEGLIKRTQEYLEEHKDLAEMLELFNMSQEEYERAVRIMQMVSLQPETMTSKSDQGDYNVDVSVPT